MRIDDFSVAGLFWLPKTPDIKAPGYLRVSNGGRINLDLIGRLVPSRGFNDFPAQLERIVGQVLTHGFVTLERCIFEKGQSDFSSSLATSTYHVHLAFLGVGFDANEEPLFNSLSFGVEGLDEWTAITGIKTSLDLQTGAATIVYSHPPKVQLWAGDGFVLTIQFGATLPALSTTTKASISQKSYLVVTSERQRPLEDFLSVAAKLRSLLCIAVDENVSLQDVEARSSSILVPGGKRRTEQRIRVIFESIRFENTPPRIRRHKILFCYDRIAAASQTTMQTWMDLLERIGPAMSLFLSARAGEFAYLNFRFLSVAQALETYHSRSVRKRKKRPSLGTRLTEMFSAFAEHFGDGADTAELVAKIVVTRNYFTHYDADLEDEAADGLDLWTIYCKLEVLIQLLLLKELGFDGTAIATMVANNSEIQEKLSRKLS